MTKHSYIDLALDELPCGCELNEFMCVRCSALEELRRLRAGSQETSFVASVRSAHGASGDRRKESGMTKTHTPGPWMTPGNGNIVGADGTLVTAVPRPKGAGASAKRDANAALIARAPTLLAENEQLRADVERLTRERDESDRSASNAQALRAFAARVAEFFSRDDPPFSSVHPLAAEARRLIGGAS